MSDLISRQAAIDALVKAIREDPYYDSNEAINGLGVCDVRVILNDLPSAQPEQRYTEEELRVFKHGISLSLLSKRSAQYWHYDADTAIEIEFLERLYDKVSADMKGEQG